MRITFIGTGYVGLVSGTCFAEMGNTVYCADIDSNKIDKLERGIIPIYEPGLKELVVKNAACKRLFFTTSIDLAINNTDIVFLAPGTPPMADGGADLQAVWDIAHTIGAFMEDYKLIVVKSTVPVGTCAKIKEIIAEELSERGVSFGFDIASNPEFLKEGDAIRDSLNPERIVVGTESEKARKTMEALYRPFTLNGHPILFMDVASSEMSKYAANAMLATRISFMNELALLCEKTGANISSVRSAVGSDSRIGNKFLYSGCGFGGSCFPKDVKALIHSGKELGCEMFLMQAVETVNAVQKTILFEKFNKVFNGDIKGKTIAMWGLSFKPQTDDIREAPSLVLIQKLLEEGCKVRVWDPVAMNNVRLFLGDCITYGNNMYEILEGADALMLVTEWKEFRIPDWESVHKALRYPLVLDGRNIYQSTELKAHGLTHIGIGIPQNK